MREAHGNAGVAVIIVGGAEAQILREIGDIGGKAGEREALGGDGQRHVGVGVARKVQRAGRNIGQAVGERDGGIARGGVRQRDGGSVARDVLRSILGEGQVPGQIMGDEFRRAAFRDGGFRDRRFWDNRFWGLGGRVWRFGDGGFGDRDFRRRLFGDRSFRPSCLRCGRFHRRLWRRYLCHRRLRIPAFMVCIVASSNRIDRSISSIYVRYVIVK